MKHIEGRVIKAVASKFYADTERGVLICFARKKLKAVGDIYVGDCVEIAKDRDVYVIETVKPRKNMLIRPYISNIDICMVVIAPQPEADLLLVDKIIVNCLQQNIKPVLTLNKCDLAHSIDLKEYEKVCDIIHCSAENGEGIDEILDIIKGKTVCFAGQSAVGKSSIINAILNSELLKVGEMSKKANRGKHTTRHSEIISIGEGTYVCDTCGFSMLDTVDIPPEDLRLYFDDMEAFRRSCKFNSCTHTDEPECAVKAHLGNDIGIGRYERYKTIYNELVERRKNKYD